jgi:hypothetical protein
VFLQTGRSGSKSFLGIEFSGSGLGFDPPECPKDRVMVFRKALGKSFEDEDDDEDEYDERRGRS